MSAFNEHFYAELDAYKGNLGALLTLKNAFREVPHDWYVVMTDIKDSTLAVQRGRHQEVNLIATGSIVSVLNIAFKMHLTLPFFFGGDGATFIVPAAIADNVMLALAAYKTNTLLNFGLELRTGKVPVCDIYANGYALHIAKYHSSDIFSIPVVLGNGLSYAEQLIKKEDFVQGDPASQQELDLTGMQCRWDKIAPPEDSEEVVTLLIVAANEEQQSTVFGEVMNLIEKIYGPAQKRQPISTPKLKLKTSTATLSTEVRARLGAVRALKLLQSWLITVLGTLYFRTSRGHNYLEALVAKSDTLVIDGKINTVISGTIHQRKALQEALDRLEGNGALTYGMHVSTASIMSCYVRDMKEGHIHFVDGAEGGYTQAAKMLKAKLRR